MPAPPDHTRLTLRQLPLPARLTLAMFLIAAGFGYFSGLVQLHFSHAKHGNLLPTTEDTVAVYHGRTGPAVSQLEMLLTTTDGPFTGAGTMRPAFFEKADDWKEAIKARPEAEVRAERDGEAQALLDWLRTGAKKDAYDQDKHVLSDILAKTPITMTFVALTDDGKVLEPRAVAIRSVLEQRCVRCHGPGGETEKYPLDRYEAVVKYMKEPSRGNYSLDKLALTTHVHLLGFAVLFTLTGLVFSFTSYPTAVRAIFGPFTLFMQVVDIACWWLARLDPVFAYVIMGTGGLVAAGLLVQVLGGLFDLFAKAGRLVLVALIVLALAGAVCGKVYVVDPYLAAKAAAAAK
jgi:hypothetical protein